jgi:hypothetical protein
LRVVERAAAELERTVRLLDANRLQLEYAEREFRE